MEGTWKEMPFWKASKHIVTGLAGLRALNYKLAIGSPKDRPNISHTAQELIKLVYSGTNYGDRASEKIDGKSV